jgi:enterochelin esterase family protein
LEFEDGETVAFVFRGKADAVGVAGDMTNWNGNRIFMQKISEGLFAYKAKYSPVARVEYKYIIDGKWGLDPLNPNSIDNGVGDRNSVLERIGRRNGTPVYSGSWPSNDAPESAGRFEEFEIVSKQFGRRIIKVYLPKNYASTSDRFGAAYLHDGTDYINRTKAANTYEALSAGGRVRPYILVFTDPHDRMKEYWANDQWADFVANELVPEIDKRYRTMANRDGRAVIGASLGGITSLNIALRHRDKFTRNGAQSASFWVDNERVLKGLEKLNAGETKFKFYIDDGVFEGVDDSRRVNVMLRAKGYPVTYIEGQTGHNWTAWRDRLADVFVALMN